MLARYKYPLQHHHDSYRILFRIRSSESWKAWKYRAIDRLHPDVRWTCCDHDVGAGAGAGADASTSVPRDHCCLHAIHEPNSASTFV